MTTKRQTILSTLPRTIVMSMLSAAAVPLIVTGVVLVMALALIGKLMVWTVE